MAQHKLSLSKALKFKNRIAGELANLRNVLKRDNSRPETKPLRSDLAAVIAQANAKQEDLIAIKSALAAANIGIYPRLAQLEEAKAQIAFLSSLPVQEGEMQVGGSYGAAATKVTFVAFLNQGDIDAHIQGCQKIANEAQDAIDEYNATHYIEVNLSE